MVGHIFVYGILKTGQERAHLWPLPPIRVQRAWTLGKLYDTGPYPALVHGYQRVAGQLWTFDEMDLAATFEVLDRIEGTNQPGIENEYLREQIVVYIDAGDTRLASTYVYAQCHRLVHLVPLPARLEWNDERYSIWPRTAKWIP